jgi:SAM-dependent methyltransferase
VTTYVLGSDDPEIARLEAQAQFLEAPTRLLLAASGITRGMRVLDLGAGLGHMSRAVADLVGPDGEVVGLEQDPRLMDAARSRTDESAPITFVQGDATTWRDDDAFDAVVGRLILFHLPDPVAAVRHHLAAVRPGGRAVFLDFDIGGVRTEPADPFMDRLRVVVQEAFAAAGADPVIGSKLRPILEGAGVRDVAGFGIATYLAPDDPAGPAMVSGVVRTLLPVIRAHGIATEEEVESDTLARRIAEALAHRGSALVPPLLVGAWGRRP